MRARVAGVLLLLVLAPSLALAVFPIALLPGVALAFESGTLAASYAAAMALVGGVIAWSYFAPPPPPPATAARPKVEVRFTSNETLTVAPESHYEEWGPNEGQVVPSSPIAMRDGIAKTLNHATYLNERFAPRETQECTVSAGCTTRLASDLEAGKIWVAASAQRYLLFVRGGVQVKYDPHGVAHRDGISAPEYGGCPAGYMYFDATSKTCSGPTIDDGVRLPSDGICAYVFDAASNRFRIDPANYGYDGSYYLWDPDCFGMPTNTPNLTVEQGGHSMSLSVPAPGVISIQERITDPETNQTVESDYVLKREPGTNSFKLDGGSYNNGLNPGGGDSGGGGGDDGGAGGDGSGAGACGGPSQPPCAVDDSGFSGLDLGGGLDESMTYATAHAGLLDDVAGRDFGISRSWLPSLLPGAPLACQPLILSPSITRGPAAGLGGVFELDVCDKLGVLREIMAWVFGLFTCIYVFRVFTGANGGNA